MGRFSGKLSIGLSRPASRMVSEVLYGMHARGSVRLSEIGRSLGDSVGLKKVIERLGRQLGKAGVCAQVQENLLALGAHEVRDETLLIADLTDIVKPYGRAMEHLARVRDGSTGEIRPGYWCLQVVAAERGRPTVVPLLEELYSQKAPEFESENEEILTAIRRVARATAGRGTWVLDRGGDRRRILSHLLSEERRFVVRLRGDRHLLWRGQQLPASAVAGECALRYRQGVVREKGSEERLYQLRIGAARVRVPFSSHPLWLVVVAGLGQKPLMLLTSLTVGRSKASVWRVVESYLTRWRVEETIRFMKQAYHLEDIRILRYARLRTMAALVMAAAYFTCAVLGRKVKLRILATHLHTAARRIFGIPDFRAYAVADGLREFLYGATAGPEALPRPPNHPLMQPLPFED